MEHTAHSPHAYMSGYHPTQMQPRTAFNAGSLNLEIPLEARLSQLSSLQRQTLLAHPAATDTCPNTTSSLSTSSPLHNRMPSSSAPRPDQSPNLEVILGMISALSLRETRALAAYISPSDVDQSRPTGMACPLEIDLLHDTGSSLRSSRC
jgi:hypothetical protein